MIKILETILTSLMVFEAMAAQLRSVLATARAEGRDLTDAELDALRQSNEQALAALVASTQQDADA